jgi:ferredoxin-thioredoxin reductase catalytic chain
LITLDKVRQRAESDAKTYGYCLNPDQRFLQDLLEGLKQNEERFGYPACPCRLASGNLEIDRDIICPCDYRDPDVAEFGACYCALYVRKDVFEGKNSVQPILERRPLEKQTRSYDFASGPSEKKTGAGIAAAKEPREIERKLWYCKQCGYVVFREDPPYVCPICKAKREMFAEIAIRIDERG